MSVLSKLAVSTAQISLDIKQLFRNLLAVNTVAAAGTNETNATGLTAGRNVITGANGVKGVRLPKAELDMSIAVVNTVAGEDLLVYPDTGAQINALTATTGAFTVPGGTEVTFYVDALLHWYVRARIVIGYVTGAGGAVTQITSRATGVTLSKLTGAITTDTTSLAAEVTATFTVTNTKVALGDVVTVAQRSGANGGNTNVYVSAVAAGSFNITVANNNAAGGTAETGAIIINFAVIKAVSA